jgi:hypothetical protein
VLLVLTCVASLLAVSKAMLHELTPGRIPQRLLHLLCSIPAGPLPQRQVPVQHRANGSQITVTVCARPALTASRRALLSNVTVCKEKEEQSPEQCKILVGSFASCPCAHIFWFFLQQLWSVQMALLCIGLVAVWSKGGTFEVRRQFVFDPLF